MEVGFKVLALQILVCFLCTIETPGLAQNGLLSTNRKSKYLHDSVRVDSLLKLSQHEFNTSVKKGLLYIDQAIEIAFNDPQLLNLYNSAKIQRSNFLIRMGNATEARRNLIEIENKLLLRKNRYQIAMYYRVLGYIHRSQQDHSGAVNSYKKALENYLKIENAEGIAAMYNNIADSFLGAQNYDSALFYVTKAEEVVSRYFPSGNQVIFTTHGQILFAQNDFVRALKYFERALGIVDPPSNGYLRRGELELYLYAAQAYLHLGMTPKAVKYLDMVAPFIETDREVESYFYHSKFVYYKSLKQFDSAFFYQAKSFSTQIDNLRRESIESTNMLKQNYDYELENAFLKAESKRQKFQVIISIGIIALVVAVLAILIYFYRQKRKTNKLLQSQNSEILTQAEELQALTEELSTQQEALSLMNQNLETIVSERTTKLRGRNLQLKEYAFYNAHRLRAPVATVLGLYGLLKFKISQSEKEVVMSKLEGAFNDLDGAIREGQRLLNNLDPEDEV